MSAVARTSSSTLSGQSRLSRTSDGARPRKTAKMASFSRRGARPVNPGAVQDATKTDAAAKSRTAASKRQGSGNLKAKEDEYRRLNAELEAKTSELVKEAEELLKGNFSILSDLDQSGSFSDGRGQSPQHREADGSLTADVTDLHQREVQPSSRQGIASCKVATGSDKIASRSTATQPQGGLLRGEFGDEESFEAYKFDVDQTVRRLENEMDDVIVTSPPRRGGVVSGGVGNYGDDILPSAAEHMGSEATIRFLKAKLRVMQEEMDRLCQECSEKDKQLSMTQTRLKEITDQNTKLHRGHKSMMSQLDKYRQSSETLNHKCEGLEAQLLSLRKEVDGMKASQKKATGQHGALEVRLNRALEETEKYKSALQKARIDLKESNKQEQAKIERLTTENKQLEKQRTELITAFKKQLKLIDVLKRQKMHIEAAKMLSFTEEEFVKALDWGAS